LITFFVFTTTVSTPTAIELYMPSDKPVTVPSTLSQSLALTFLLAGNNRLFYYNGDFSEAEKANQVFETNYSVYNGIGNVIREKKKSLELSGRFPEGSKGLMLIIKPGSDASYKNTVDALDEATINEVKKYAIVEQTEAEKTYLLKMTDQGFNSAR